jgi:hypothetical protein
MYKEVHAFRRKPLEELTRSDFVTFKALEFTHRPCHERLIDVLQHGIQRRGGIAPMLRNPSPEERIDLPGDVLQGELCLTS